MHEPTKDKEKWNQLFMTMGIINKKEGTIYADLTGKFPITSMDGMQAIFIMYDWKSGVEGLKKKITGLWVLLLKPKMKITT